MKLFLVATSRSVTHIPTLFQVSTKSNKDFKDIDFLQTKEQKAG